ncbi:epi-neemfruitin B 7-O-acetyltransferse L7AT-like [Bidens hawaiensis]|uniref:epi-neemfruitin B 7-O-acetyltransferse L7AT-like n=1 Tax=Bidens hawaiensis TaxID=980011 RepID=UPI004049E3D4
MKWLTAARKATQRFLNSQRCRIHRGSSRHVFGASNALAWSKHDQMHSLSLYSGHFYSTSTVLNATESSQRFQDGKKIQNEVKKVDIEIISRETIKPSSPTPEHLRTYNFCIIDQYMYDIYTPLILFLPNTDKASVTDVLTKRSKHLKEALSKILTRFYPVAGKVKDNLRIECNDEGISYTEARVNETLQDFLDHPDDERVRGLIPESFFSIESLKGNCLLGIQVNIFKCGGIGLSTSVSHKIFDGHIYFMFMNAWAAAARGSPQIVSPSFVASKIFPTNPHLEYSVPSKLRTTKRLSTKRFVFDSTALALLKAQPVASASSANPPTRTEAISALIWKTAANAASKVRPFGPQSPHALLSMVNLRTRASPPFPKESIGNLVDAAGAICFPSEHLDLPTMMGEVRESIAKLNSDFIESLKGENGHETFNVILRKINQLADMIGEGDFVFSTSLLNSGVYELDFGWGKPIWFYMMNAGFARFLTLNDTLKGGGVEAIVTLAPDEMEIFECDPELLSYAIVNPSPLVFIR